MSCATPWELAAMVYYSLCAALSARELGTINMEIEKLKLEMPLSKATKKVVENFSETRMLDLHINL